MPLIFLLSAACAALSCGSADQASEPAEVSEPVEAAPVEAALAQPEPEQEPRPAADAPMGPTPAKLVEFDGAWHFLSESRRLRIWRPAVEFTMEVDATGHPTDCKVVDEFRKTYVNMKLCEVLMDHHTFEPARNAQNEPVPGSYRARLSYADLREQVN